MKKKLLSLFAIAMLVCLVLCLVACGDNDDNNTPPADDPDFKFELNEDGTGYILDRYFGSDTEVTVPATYNGLPVTEIDDFRDGEDVTKVTLPSSVKKIQGSSFSGMPKLKEVVLSEGLEEIEGTAFKDSTLEKINIPSTIKIIEGSAFENTQIVEFKIPDNAPIEVLGHYTFQDCEKLEVVELSSNIKKLGQRVFSNCVKLAAIDLKNVEEIEQGCFENCTELATVDFGNKTKKLDGEVFINCAITDVTISNPGVNFTGAAFENCLALKTISLAPKMNFGSRAVFKGCVNVEKITFEPQGYTRLQNLFGNFKGDYSEALQSLTTVNVIGTQKLPDDFGANFSKLKNITVADTVLGAGTGCFINTQWYEDQPDGLVYASNTLIGYKGSKPDGDVTLRENTTGIADEAFKDCTDITKIVLPNTVKAIGSSAFSGVTAIGGEFTLPNDLEAIYDNAFLNCGITKVNFNSKLRILEREAFKGCPIEGEIVLPETMERYGENCFCDSQITKITLKFVGNLNLYEILGTRPAGLTEAVVRGTYLPEYAFYKFNSIKQITCLDKITVIPEEAFAFTGLTEFDFGDVIEIGDYAFENCPSIINVSLSAAKEIGTRAFQGCSSLENVTLGGGVKKIGDYAFGYCNKLENVKLNNGLEYIGKSAFERSNLNSLIIPSSVTYVGEKLVYGLLGTKPNFKLFVESSSPNANWDSKWNANIIEIFEEQEEINLFPTYYMSETDISSDELSYWHYVGETPTPWKD